MSSVYGLEQQRFLPASLEARLTGFLGRVGGLSVLAAVALLWTCVLSWSVTDPSLTHATGGDIKNALGRPGAIAAGLLLETLGLAAAIALLAPMLWAIELITSERVRGFGQKLAYYPLTLLAFAAALSSMTKPAAWPLEHGLGGIMGDIITSFTVSLFALLSPEHASLISTILFFAAALAMLGPGLGLEAAPRKTRSRASHDAPRHVPALDPTDTTPDDGLHLSLPPDEIRRHNAGGFDMNAPDLDDDLEPVDPAIELSSRAIAERFAPMNGRPPATPKLEPRLSPAPPTHSAQGGAMLRRGPAPKPAKRYADPVYKRPATAMLKRIAPGKGGAEVSQTVLRGTARLLEDVLADFGVKGEVRDIKPGPVVTLFELEPARGTKASRIMALADDIARSMSAKSARVAVIPGRNAIGIELPNARRDAVGLRDLLESQAFTSADGALPLALGKSIGGEPVVADLARMPHLLVAGTTGSGKSVGVNAMILSILFRMTPEECRFLMIDPKMLELSVYNGIPHLLCPVVTEPQKAVSALNWVVSEMEERYKRMAKLSVRNIEAFNSRVKTATTRGEPLGRTVQTGFHPDTGEPVFEREEMKSETMPYIVVVVDEFADLMITAGKDIETAVQRLAQKARAAGIHLIMATQRPSVDIITGTIKANFPTRISFKVASKIDSRTILNDHGAEQLLGQGDMLFAGGSGLTLRVHGPFVSDDEVESIAAYLRTQGEPRYIDDIGKDRVGDEVGSAASAEGHDSLYDRAVALVLRDKKASTSYVQRRLSIGYNRAADLIERMEREGLVSAPNHTGRREILADHAAHGDAA